MNVTIHKPDSPEPVYTTSDKLENALIASLFRWPAIIDEVAQVVRDEMFRRNNSRVIWSIMMDMHGRVPIDLVTVAQELNKRGLLDEVGGHYGLANLWDSEPTGGHAVHYAEGVRDAYLRRSLGLLGHSLVREGESPSSSAIEAVEAAERNLWGLSELGASGEATDLSAEYTTIVNSAERSRGDIDGIPTGFYDLDGILGGMQNTQLIVVGARPATGKTALGLSIARNLALSDMPVFFASLEQSKHELAERMLAAQASIDGQRLRRGMITREQRELVSSASDYLADAPLHVDDNASQTCQRIAANARRLKRRFGIRAVFVDYLQLIQPEDRRMKRYEQIGQISRRLKILARELDLPVIALAQLNRGTEDHKEPRLSDLRDSGDIEQDADTVLLLHRASNIDSDIVPIEVIVAKHRNGPCGRITLAFNKPFVRFDNYTTTEPNW